MVSAVPISIWSLLACLCALLLTNCNAKKWPKKSAVPPPGIDENGCDCKWTPWMDNDDYNSRVGDDVTYQNLRRTHDFCQNPTNIQCRSKRRWQIPFPLLRVFDTTCDVETGLKCVSRPFSKLRSRKETPHLCDDFEVTVQCCYCTTTTSAPKSTSATTTVAETTTDKYSKSEKHPIPGNIMVPNDTLKESWTSEDSLPVTMILIIVFGCVIIIGFIAVIWLILSRSTLHGKKKTPLQNFYQEVPVTTDQVTVITLDPMESTKKPVSLPDTSASNDYLNTSSDDEGYRSRQTYHRKRKKRSQRNRALRNGNQPSRGNTSDSFEFPTLDSRTPTDENSDDVRFRRWFPDEYERALEQKKRQQPTPKARSIFTTPFNSSTKKSSSFAGDES